MWTCPRCERRFGRKQSHECRPTMHPDDWFARHPAWQRPLVEAAIAAVTEAAGDDDLDVEYADVGVLVKRDRTFMELRPDAPRGKERVVLTLILDRQAPHPRRRRCTEWNGRWGHYFDLHSPDDLDEDLLDLIAESYDTGGTRG